MDCRTTICEQGENDEHNYIIARNIQPSASTTQTAWAGLLDTTSAAGANRIADCTCGCRRALPGSRHHYRPAVVRTARPHARCRRVPDAYLLHGAGQPDGASRGWGWHSIRRLGLGAARAHTAGPRL